MQTTRILFTLALLFGGAALAQETAVQTYRIDPERSQVLIHVGKSGLFSFMAGHEHEVETSRIQGQVRYTAADPLATALTLQIDAASLRVTGRGEPADDVPEVQRVMLSDRVLDVERHPTITFDSTAIARGQRGTSSEYVVTGNLTLKGVTRPVESPVQVRVEGNTLTATGELTIEQTDFGIEPVSVARVVNVKDELAIRFTIVGAVAPAGPQ
jgi:polyisoprenoid-binding protein YceI